MDSSLQVATQDKLYQASNRVMEHPIEILVTLLQHSIGLQNDSNSDLLWRSDPLSRVHLPLYCGPRNNP